MATPIDRLHSLLATRQGRRGAIQSAASAAGGALLLKASLNPSGPPVLAQDDEDDSGHGRGRGRGGDDDNSGSGNAEDRDGDEPEQPVDIPPGSLEVRIVGDDAGDFVPAELTVDVGQSVTFVNVHSDEHTATGSGFDTGIIPDEGGTATVVLDTPGVFPYACQIHPEMTGVIRVRDETGIVPETQTAAQDIPAGATTVVIVNLAFDPATITVSTGTTVAWTNDDAVPHTVTSVDGLFDSGIFDPGGSFAFTFNDPGSFPYSCQLHPQMQGSVTAEGEPVAAAADAQTAQAVAEATPAGAAAPPPGASGPTGIWLLELTPENDVIFGGQQALVAFHADGTLEADFAAAPGTGLPANLVTSGRGEWTARNGILDLSLAALMSDADQRFAATLMVSGEGQVMPDGASLEGTFDFEVVGTEGRPIGQGSGTFGGRRLPLDP